MNSPIQFSADDPLYSKCTLYTVQDGIKAGRLKIVEVLSENSSDPITELFVENKLPAQYGCWAWLFFGPSGLPVSYGTRPTYLLSCSDVIVVSPDSGIIFDDLAVLDRHTQFLPSPSPEARFRRLQGSDLLLRNEEENFLKGSYALGFTPVSSNYSHWITEVLPFWITYADRLKPMGVKLLLGTVSNFQEQALAVLGIEPGDVVKIGPGRLRVEHLYLTSPMEVGAPASLVRDAAEKLVQQLGGYAREEDRRRLFLSRSDATTRRLLNEQQITRRLARYGFSIVRCSELSFVEQVKLLASASAVVGIHGAALSNVIFCKPGTKFLELFPEFCVHPHYRLLAHRAGVRYGFLQGTSFENEDSRTDDLAARLRAWNQDFVINPQLVEQAAHWVAS